MSPSALMRCSSLAAGVPACRRPAAFTPVCSASSSGRTPGPARVLPRREQQQQQQQSSSSDASTSGSVTSSPLQLPSMAAAMFLLQQLPASAMDMVASNPFQGVQANSLYVTLGLFLMCVPGIYSQVKRAPQVIKQRKTFEVDGPARPTAMPLDERARQVFRYFKKYNYEVKGTGDVITFVGLYAADRGQAAAVTFYTFIGLGCIALVLATVYPEVGNWWYMLTLLAPGAWFYYFARGTRQEEVKVKMVTADNEQTTDIIIEGDREEIERFRKELQLFEKGMVYVKGILEQ